MKTNYLKQIKIKLNETFEIKAWEFFAYGQFCLYLGLAIGFTS